MDRDRHSNTFRLAYIFFATYIVFAMMIAVSKETKTVEVIDKTNTEVETTTEALVETTTEEQIGRMIGTSRSNIYGWENGEHLPSARHIRTICRHFNVSADWLLGV